MVDKITNHVQGGRDRLLAQYKDKPILASVLTSFINRVQEIEDAFFELLDGRSIFTAVGAQLDGIGEIVGQPRGEFEDDEVYRIILLAAIGRNVSEGEISRVINVYNLLTGADRGHLQEHYPADVSLHSNADPDPDLWTFIFEAARRTLAASVRLTEIGEFDPDEPFAFDDGDGFSDVLEPTAGGVFASLHGQELGAAHGVELEPFAFASDDDTDDGLGFSDLYDIFEGGQFVSL